MNQKREIILIAVLALVVAANCYDILIDYRHGVADWHLYTESFVVLVSSIAIALLLNDLRIQRREIHALRQDLEASASKPRMTSEAEQKIRRDMGDLIQSQFERWKLTPSEREVALLLLKGLSFKEIAAVRGTGEKTVRQQASNIYAKADVSGRASFSAWFIEDIL